MLALVTVAARAFSRTRQFTVAVFTLVAVLPLSPPPCLADALDTTVAASPRNGLRTTDFDEALRDAEWDGRWDVVASDRSSASERNSGQNRGQTLAGEQVEPTQALSPAVGAALGGLPFRQAMRSSPGRQQNTAVRAGVSLGLASVPFMIGDTSAGTCFSLGGVIPADVSHPTLTCARLNISENNTVLPVDRFYYSYRHFNNASRVRIFQFEEIFDYDRHTLGAEKTFWGGLGSVEVRMPIERRLRSDIISLVDETSGFADAVAASQDAEVDIGNVSIITKLLLIERQQFALAAGMGVTVPTSRDVSYDALVNVQVITPVPDLTIQTFARFENDYENETVYLSPFLAWLFTPDPSSGSRWYHQGFLQFEVAANPSTLTTNGFGFSDFFFLGTNVDNSVFQTPNGQPTQTDVFAQTLMRLNLGLGYQVTDPDASRWISNIKTLFEMHYTTTLQRANTQLIAIDELTAGGPGGVAAVFPQLARAGNADPRTDILNFAAGVSMDVGRFQVTNGVVAPARRAPDRGFDFEYNLQVQLLF